MDQQAVILLVLRWAIKLDSAARGSGRPFSLSLRERVLCLMKGEVCLAPTAQQGVRPPLRLFTSPQRRRSDFSPTLKQCRTEVRSEEHTSELQSRQYLV